MATSYSPFRYPGGKQILARVLGHLIKLNGREGGIHVEPYAGGAGAALSLLFGEHVGHLMLNDADPSVHAFWSSILTRTKSFLKLLRDTPLSVAEWERQRQIYLQPSRHSRLRLGFATFYLNRCNRSGIIGNAGLIGGRNQTGRWKLDARFNRTELARRIERIAMYRDRIQLHNLDAIQFLRQHVSTSELLRRAFVYLDPPYYLKGSQLYLNHYKPADHERLAAYLMHNAKFTWVLSYDNVPEIRRLYAGLRQVQFRLGYSAREWRVGKEIMISKHEVAFPDRWKARIPDQCVTSADRIQIPMAG